MRIPDLLLIFSLFVILFSLIAILVTFLLGRWVLVRKIALYLFTYIGAYVLLLVGVSVLSPQQVLQLHQLRCFSEWCVSVEGVEQRAAIGSTQAQGRFVLVTIQVSSQAKRVSQRAVDAQAYLLDQEGQRYDVSSEGQPALEALGQAGQPLDSPVEPAGSFTYVAVFDVPTGTAGLGLVVQHGAFPGAIIIGDGQSFLHAPTIVQLPSE